MGRWIVQLCAIALQIWAAVCIIFGVASPFVLFLAGPLFILSHQFLAIFHEAGHAIVARAVGWRVIVFTVRPFAWRVRYRDLTWMPLRRGGNAGFVSTVPRRPETASPKRYAALVLAGPLANLLLAALLISGSTGWMAYFDRPTLGVSLIAFGLGLQSLAMGISNLVPKGHSDGALLLRYWRGNHARPGIDALGWLHRLRIHCERLRDYPRWMIERARATENPPEGLFAMLDSIDVGMLLDGEVVDPAAARRALDSYRATYGASEWLNSCDAYFTVIWEKDAARARATLWHGERSEDMRPMMAAAEAAVAAIEGNGATAGVRLAEMRAAVKAASPYRNLTFRDLGRQIEALIAAHAAEPSSPASHYGYATAS